MRKNNYQNIFASVNGRKKFNFLAKKVTHYKIGGPIDFLCYPKTNCDCSTLIKLCRYHKIPYFVLGKGSNLLISDEGFRGVFISLDDCSNDIYLSKEKSFVGAGILLWDFIKKTIKCGLGDMSHLSLIPGTIGGALFMNAGAFGVEIENFVESVDVISQNGMFETLPHKECGFQYREAIHLRDKIILGACLNLDTCDIETMRKNSNYVVERRKARQPLKYPSCGSVFKRPKGSYAGMLIEESGLKGFSVGDAKLSEKHANFILNIRRANAHDVYEIIKHVQRTVKEKYNIHLEREVKLIGFKHVKI